MAVLEGRPVQQLRAELPRFRKPRIVEPNVGRSLGNDVSRGCIRIAILATQPIHLPSVDVARRQHRQPSRLGHHDRRMLYLNSNSFG